MKKILILVMVSMLLLSFAACGKKEANPLDDMALSDIMSQILDGVETPMVGEVEITDENIGMYLFIDPVEGAEGLASEGMISAIAHSICLYKVPEGADVDAVAQSIKDNANPRKWICVEAEKTEVVVQGRVILLAMSSAATVDAIVANFNALAAK